MAHRKLGRTSEHRMSLLRNLAASLILHDRIRTTEAKAKELRPFVEKLVTLGKRDSLHARRRALTILPRKDVVRRLFAEISPRFSERPGGYTRILKIGPRSGDGAPMAFIQFVDYQFEGADAPSPASESKPSTKKAKKDEDVEAEEVEAAAADAAETDADADADADDGEEVKAPKAKKKAAKKKTTKKAAKKKTSKKKTGS